MEKKKVKKTNTKKVVMKEEPVKEIKNKEIRDKRYLIIGILYLVCCFLWVIGAAEKIMVGEKYIIDILLGTLWLILSAIYFARYRKGKK